MAVWQMFSGVDLQHRLLAVNERRGMSLPEPLKPHVLDLMKSLVLGLVFSFPNSDILNNVLQRMGGLASVHGLVAQDSVKAYTEVGYTEGVRSYR